MLKVKMSSLFPLAERFIFNIKYNILIFTSRESAPGHRVSPESPKPEQETDESAKDSKVLLCLTLGFQW